MTASTKNFGEAAAAMDAHAGRGALELFDRAIRREIPKFQSFIACKY
jgi:hypothetical protein